MAEIDGDFVVFLIGARFNSFHLLKTVLDLGGRRGMKHMLDYLVAHPEKGLLGYQMGLPAIVQYWRSFDHLEAFANDAATRTWPCGATTGAGSAPAPGPGCTRRTWSGRRVRGDVREHAAVRAGQGGPAGSAGRGKTARQRFRGRARAGPARASGSRSATAAMPASMARSPVSPKPSTSCGGAGTRAARKGAIPYRPCWTRSATTRATRG